MSDEKSQIPSECSSKATKATDLVSISYESLTSLFHCTNNYKFCMRTNHDKEKNLESLLDKIHQAYASTDSLGIIVLTDMPKNYSALRMKVLPLAQKLVTLSPAVLEAMTIPNADFQVGWSYGKEKLDKDRVDTAKGSFYFNPLTDNILIDIASRDNCHLEDIVGWDNMAYKTPNVWPSTSNLKEFEGSLKEMGRMVHRIGLAIAQLCDEYLLRQCPGYTRNKIFSLLSTSLNCKARLLHYFPLAGSNDEMNEDDQKTHDYNTWCGWHNDHGSLTGLVPGLYLDSHGNALPECPDPDAGLYIKSRSGTIHHIFLPSDSLAFQVGETTQIHSGGLLQATPHAVRGCYSNNKVEGNITRESLAIFMEPEYSDTLDLPLGRALQDLQTELAERNLPNTVKGLKSRYQTGMNFQDFSDATIAAFHQ